MADQPTPPNEGFPNPVVRDDLRDPDEQTAEQAAASKAAGTHAAPAEESDAEDTTWP